MAQFRKRSPVVSGPSDDHLPFFSVTDADLFRRTLAQAFAESGMEMQVFRDHLVDVNGRTFGVYNAATVCHHDERGKAAWPELARDHVRRLLDNLNAPSVLDTMTEKELHALVYPRLYERSGMPPEGFTSYAVEFSDDVLEILNVDQPETVLVLDDETVQRFGGRTALRKPALKNLLGLLPRVEVEQVRSEKGLRLDVVTSDSMFTATLALVMPELLQHLGMLPVPYGVFVCMPFRFQIAVHDIRDRSAVASLNAMVGFALSGFHDGIGPLTPHVFWWHQGSFEQVTSDGEKGWTVVIPPALTQLLNALP
ncbi:MAG: hypothetical protein JWO12_395 [Frankiales bacterium]|nr:hypothetical protein [Frankiales bacterium]